MCSARVSYGDAHPRMIQMLVQFVYLFNRFKVSPISATVLNT